jgi:hypothetical protein
MNLSGVGDLTVGRLACCAGLVWRFRLFLLASALGREVILSGHPIQD